MSYIHDPNASLRYGQDWTDWLSTGETLASATATCATPGITISAVVTASPIVSFLAAGGTDGVDYDVTCHIVTSADREDDRTFRFKVRER